MSGSTAHASEGRSSSAPGTVARSAAVLLHPVSSATSAVRSLPGAGMVESALSGVLDTVGIVSPHARRVAAYTGAGLLGAAGLVEWPVAAAGAAVVWLTQSRDGGDGPSPATPHKGSTPVKPSAQAKRTTAAETEAPAAERPPAKAAATRKTAKKSAPRAGKPSAPKPATTAKSPTARAAAPSGAGRRAGSRTTAGKAKPTTARKS
ncbi:hypothetical protein [Streptacidiphilus fuscans]|uniref:hypothetical protein n=1 Tax=Streptacidiphilus fuscans TaxID=2789292 RepID=UPI001F43EFF6|nr:hypothetical protein [Streptacidiphilus fuscans]